MSKSLIKLINAALVPAAVMICGKVVGLAITNAIFNLSWNIESDPNNFFSVKIVYNTIHDQMIAASYSNLIMFIAIFIGFLFVLFRALFLHSSHITPRMIARLATNNLLDLIQDSFEIYHNASVWLISTWIALFAIISNVLLGKAYNWTAVLSLAIALIATTALLRDVSHEIKIAKKHINKHII